MPEELINISKMSMEQAQFERILRHRSIIEGICPSCERMVNYSHERESAGGKHETEGQPPAVAGRPFDAAKGDEK